MAPSQIQAISLNRSASEASTEDNTALSQSPIGQAAAIHALMQQAIAPNPTDLDIPELLQEAESAIARKLKEYAAEPYKYLEIRMMTWEIMVDHFMQLSAIHGNDASMADRYTAIAERLQNTALKILRESQKAYKAQGKRYCSSRYDYDHLDHKPEPKPERMLTSLGNEPQDWWTEDEYECFWRELPD